MENSPFPPPPSTPVPNMDGSDVDMYPVLADGVLIAFCWKPNPESAVDLYCAETPSLLVH